MQIEFESSKIKYFDLILAACQSQEESAEIIVPDTMADIAVIAAIKANITLRSRVTDTGRATVSGSIDAVVLYYPEEGAELKKLSTEIPFSASVSDGKITPECRLISNVKLSFVDASIINSRKVIVRASLVTEFNVYSENYMELTDASSDTKNLEVLPHRAKAELVVDTVEKTNTVSDEYAFSGEDDDMEILQHGVQVQCDDYKLVGNKLVIRARADYEILCLINGQTIKHFEYTKDFTHIMELTDAQNEDKFQVWMTVTGTYIECTQPDDVGARRINTQMQILVQCLQKREAELNYLSDAYSTAGSFKPEIKRYTLPGETNDNVINDMLVKKLDEGEKISKLLSASGRCFGTSQTSDGNVRTTVYVDALYILSDGRLRSCKRKFEMTVNCEANDYKSVWAETAELYSAIGDGGIDIRASIDFHLISEKPLDIISVTGGELEDENKKKTSGSVILRRVTANDDMWQLAKRYGSRVAVINEINHIDENGIEGIRMIIIPQVR